MKKPDEQKWLWWLGAFLVAGLFAAVVTENFALLLLPFGAAVVWLALNRLDVLLLVTVALTPLSVTLKDEAFNVGLSIPSEPLLFGITLLLLFRLILGGKVNGAVANHPVSWALYFYLAWMGLTVLTSELPLVSAKHWIARIWFIVPLFFLMVHVLMDPKRRDLFFWLYYIPLSIAAIYTLTVHSTFGFSKETSTWVSFPFYKEHTVYGAVLAMYTPIAFYFAIRRQSLLSRIGTTSLLLLLLVALVLSYTRAAWLSVVVAAGVFVLHRLRIGLGTTVFAALLLVVGLYLSSDQIVRSFEKNDAVSSENLGQHVQSMSNVSTDASNLERLNRWNSALRMFEERPGVGWGPGTYQFLYAPFQNSRDLTIISTNNGDNGNAHSEYIGPLAEQGIPGLIVVLLVIAAIFSTGFQVLTNYRLLSDERSYWLAVCAVLGLVTYFTHGILNNFLDTDKASVPVWGFTALLVAMQLRNLRE